MSYLQHHGILGMKWGVRHDNYPLSAGEHTASEKKAGWKKSLDPKTYTTVKKGTAIYRVSNNVNDQTYDNKKYVSLNSSDHKKWQKYIGDRYNKTGRQAYNIMYTALKDLKIANYSEVGKIYAEKMKQKDDTFLKQAIKDTEYSSNSLGYKSQDPNDLLSLNFAMQTETGKAFVKELMDRGYQGVQDRHGQNTSKNPVIIFDPDNNMSKSGVSLYKSRKVR